MAFQFTIAPACSPSYCAAITATSLGPVQAAVQQAVAHAFASADSTSFDAADELSLCPAVASSAHQPVVCAIVATHSRSLPATCNGTVHATVEPSIPTATAMAVRATIQEA